jgi:hypothetical protein
MKALAAWPLFTVSAVAQIVSSPTLIAIGEPRHVLAETAIAVSTTAQKRAIISWIDRVFDSNGDRMSQNLYYASTNDAFGTVLLGPAVLPAVSCSTSAEDTADPFAARAPNGDLFIGGYQEAASDSIHGFFIDRLAAGASSLDSNFPVGFQCYGGADKGLIACGPRASDTANQVICLTASAGPLGVCQEPRRRLVGACSLDSVGAFWSPMAPAFSIRRSGGSPCDENGHAAMPVIVQGGTSMGRIVVAFMRYFEGPTAVIHSDDGGSTWSFDPNSNDGAIDHAGAAQIVVPSASDIPASQTNNWNSLNFFPSITTDPTNPSNVYVAFVGTADQSGSDRNLDLYVALSTDAGATFSAGNVRRLTDSELGDTALSESADQIFPSVAVDGYGGINLLYYLVDDDGQLNAKYAKLPSFTASPFVAKLNDPFTPDVFSTNEGNFIGDYHMIGASGCTVIPAYMSVHEDPTTHDRRYAIYVNHIKICEADADDNGLVDAGDPPAFASQFLVTDPRADLTQDQAVDAADVLRFQETYICGCGAP